MASRSSSESITRKPVGSSANSSAPVFFDGESKENAGQHPLPAIPQPHSTRVHGAPMSPVTANIQNENRPTQESQGIRVVQDEGIQKSPSKPRDSSHAADGYDAKVLRGHELPHRPSYTIQESEHQQPQMGVISSNEDFHFGTDSNESLPGQEGHERHASQGQDETEPPSVPSLQYFHQSARSEDLAVRSGNNRSQGHYSTQNVVDAGQSINRHLTPNSNARYISQMQRPTSTYSDFGANRRSPGHISQSPSWGGRSSVQSGRSNSSRPLSYLDLNNVAYPQMPPAPLALDNSQLRAVVGTHASLLSNQKTLEMYRQNIKKLNDPETQYAFAVFLVDTAKEMEDGAAMPGQRKASSKSSSKGRDSPYVENAPASKQELLSEAKQILQKLSDKSYPFAQYYLADGYASGLFSKNGDADYTVAFPLFVSASKHGHAEAGYRAALCYEFGWGVRKDPTKALQFLRNSSSKNHPGAMTRLGRACLSGDLGEQKYREGIKWLKRGTESADVQYNAAPFYLAQLYENGDGGDIFKDEAYAAQLFTQAADLGHAESAFRMGDAYEHGRLCCPRDPALSVHFYTGAAQRMHPLAMMSLCAWYMIGAEPVLEKDENEAYEWAREAAILGLTKAEYAVGYFTEMGIGCRRDPLEANVWYVKAAAAGDERAKHRIAAINAAASGGNPMNVTPAKARRAKKAMSTIPAIDEKLAQDEKPEKPEKPEKECIVM